MREGEGRMEGEEVRLSARGSFGCTLKWLKDMGI